MDDVESGYYIELNSKPEMTRKHSNQQSDDSANRSSFGESLAGQMRNMDRYSGSNSSENEMTHGPSGKANTSFGAGNDQFFDPVNEIYTLDKGRSKLYKEVFKLYTHRQDDFHSEDESSEGYDYSTSRLSSFDSGRYKKKAFLWLMILVLVSNPILGGYNLYHFSNYPRLFNNSKLSEFINNYPNFALDAEVLSSTKSSNRSKSSDVDGHNVDGSESGFSFNPFKWLKKSFVELRSLGSGRKGSDKTKNKDFQDKLKKAEDKLKQELLDVTATLSKKVTRYCFVEIFGEIIFGLFSLLLVTLCRFPCNNEHSVRFMMPSLFMFYMIIYRILACYILITSFKIIFYSVLIYKPGWAPKVPSLLVYLLTFKSLNLKSKLPFLRYIYQLDTLNLRLLLAFAIQNVYITFSETLEMFAFFFKVIVSTFKKKILKRSDVNFYSSNDHGSKLFKRCFSRDTFSSSDPHEKYIHSLYNYASDIGTYLKNIELSDYTKGLDDLSNKFKNRKSNADDY